MLTKVDRQVSQFKGRMLKGKVGDGGEARTQKLLHDEGDVYTAGGDGAVFRWCKVAHLASSPLGCSQGSGLTQDRTNNNEQEQAELELDKRHSLTHDRTNNNEQEQRSWSQTKKQKPSLTQDRNNNNEQEQRRWSTLSLLGV